MTAVFSFGVSGLARYLSHAELMRVFQRAAVRAGWPLQFSEGFNPRPRLSLPFPKPVGVETEADLAQIRLYRRPDLADPGSLADSLQRQLPAGIVIEKAWIMPVKGCYQPVLAQYQLFLSDHRELERIRSRAHFILQQGCILLDRPMRPGQRRVDVRPFLDRIDLNECICVQYRIIDGATIRVSEVMQLLEVDLEDLARPIRRRAVQWVLSAGRKVDIAQ